MPLMLGKECFSRFLETRFPISVQREFTTFCKPTRMSKLFSDRNKRSSFQKIKKCSVSLIEVILLKIRFWCTVCVYGLVAIYSTIIIGLCNNKKISFISSTVFVVTFCNQGAIATNLFSKIYRVSHSTSNNDFRSKL